METETKRIRISKTEDRRQKTEEGRPKREDRRGKTEDGRRKTEDGRQSNLKTYEEKQKAIAKASKKSSIGQLSGIWRIW